MENTEVKKDLVEMTHRLWIGFRCPTCNGHSIKWRSGREHPKEAIIQDMMLIEGNWHPAIHGEYRIGSSEEMLDLQFEDSEWSCEECGFVLTKDDGTPVRTKEEVVWWLVGNRYCHEEAEQKMLAEDYEGCLNSLFASEGDGSLGRDGEALTLSCPKCGHQEFVVVQEALTVTPIRTVEGKLAWHYEEQLLADHLESQETHYFCLKCGFEAPEPFDEWVEDGCLEDWDEFEE